MSPRAAWRLQALGFEQVYDYEGGKMDWMAFWLPWEGSTRAEPRLGDLLHRDVPRCSPSDRLADVSALMTAGWSLCAVVNEEGILLGTDGPFANVLKIRPPMPFAEADGDALVVALNRILEELS